MNLSGYAFQLLDHSQPCFCVKSGNTLNKENSSELRAALQKYRTQEYPIIYLDIRAIEEMDLAGANELIHAHYTLQQSSQRLVLLYRRHSAVERWISHTGMNQFMELAVTPGY